MAHIVMQKMTVEVSVLCRFGENVDEIIPVEARAAFEEALAELISRPGAVIEVQIGGLLSGDGAPLVPDSRAASSSIGEAPERRPRRTAPAEVVDNSTE